MDTTKLFHVLVIGGALLASGCSEDTDSDSEERVSVSVGNADSAVDAIDGAVETDAETETVPGELEDCGFCPNELCCETGDSGQAKTKAGFECCWATAC